MNRIIIAPLKIIIAILNSDNDQPVINIHHRHLKMTFSFSDKKE